MNTASQVKPVRCAGFFKPCIRASGARLVPSMRNSVWQQLLHLSDYAVAIPRTPATCPSATLRPHPRTHLGMHHSRSPIATRAHRWRTGAMTTIITCSAAAQPPHASAAMGPKYPKRVQQALDYIDAHPQQVGSIAMYYEPTDQLHTPPPDPIQGLTPSDVLPPTSSSSSSSSGGGSSGSVTAPEAAQHFARTVAALLYVAVGGLDHAHNLVTPLAWGAWTAYGGNPIANSPAFREAAYVHALVHRAEGFSDGEFGTGFSNANYHYRLATAESHPIAQPLIQEARRLAQGSPKLEQIVQLHGDTFQPTKFVSTCSQALSSKDKELVGFCNAVARAEWSLLFRHCYQRMQEATKP